ncbi:PLP-dependent aspartate aminotransferase family protein [Paenibacillus xylanexedens]|uniref:trans-sulfuration enzyme family protein n=1 Tax=Paenibacillus xylanexedens TaxID=528191 RepID=UPI0011A0C937|nr:aminotransferase class I/II-fold pyridoxal phosphate-dependent enzyme [Paenibacillus xylanexedens]
MSEQNKNSGSSDSSELKFDTKLLHFGDEVDKTTGASSVPIYQASTFHHFDIFNPPQHDYSRSGNPTRQALEDYITLLEGGVRGFAYSSGMAAISSVFMMFSAGDHIIVTEDVYGGTYRLLTSILNRMQIDTTFVDMTDIEEVKAAIQPNTKAVYMETPSNPTLKITDIAAVTSWAQEHELVTILDNTFMTPYYQRPIELGVDIVVHSATKFLGGHSDVLAGLAVARTEALGKQLKQLQNGLGTVLGAQESWLLMRGMKTLGARMAHSEQSTAKLAAWLNERSDVSAVYYPGLQDHPGREVHERQSTGYGAVVSFDVGSGDRAKAVLNRVKLPIVAVSLGAVESILSYPAMMSHAAMPAEVRRDRGITDGLLRFSVGLEDIDDLIADLEQALEESK